jgi:hypothetical protein
MCECDLQEKYNHIPCIDVAITLSSWTKLLLVLLDFETQNKG